MTRAKAVQHLKDLCKMYTDTYGHWDKLPHASKQEDWDSLGLTPNSFAEIIDVFKDKETKN